jgi:hypothetical protein
VQQGDRIHLSWLSWQNRNTIGTHPAIASD